MYKNLIATLPIALFMTLASCQKLDSELDFSEERANQNLEEIENHDRELEATEYKDDIQQDSISDHRDNLISHQEQLDKHAATLTRHEELLETHSESIVANTDAIAANGEVLKKHDAQLTVTDEKLAAHSSLLSDHEALLESHDSEIDDLQEFKDKVEGNAQDFMASEANAIIVGRINNLDERLVITEDCLQNPASEKCQTINKIKACLKAPRSGLAAVDGEFCRSIRETFEALKEHDTRLDGHDQKIAKLEADLIALDNRLTTRMDALETRIAHNEATITKMLSDMDQMDSSIIVVSDLITALQDDLRGLFEIVRTNIASSGLGGIDFFQCFESDAPGVCAGDGDI